MSKPGVTVKFAQSLDGRIATASGESRWISGEEARRFVHQLRSEHDAIMVGVATVLADDPELTVRLVEGRDPLRIVVDPSLRIPLTARVLAKGAAAGTLIVCAETAEKAREEAIQKLGGSMLRLASGDQVELDVRQLLEALHKRGINSLLVEGGKRLITSLVAARAVDRLIVIIAPKIIGQGIEAIGDLGIARLSNAITFSSFETRRLGPDIVFDGRVARTGQ